jgi:hypothetical protein
MATARGPRRPRERTPFGEEVRLAFSRAAPRSRRGPPRCLGIGGPAARRDALSGALAPQAELHEPSARDGVETVGRNLVEAEAGIEFLSPEHRREGVQEDPIVGERSGPIEGGLGQESPETAPAKALPHVEPLHFAAPGVHAAEGDTARWARVRPGHEKRPGGWRVFAGEPREFFLETLKGQIDSEGRCVLEEELSCAPHVGRRFHVADAIHWEEGQTGSENQREVGAVPPAVRFRPGPSRGITPPRAKASIWMGRGGGTGRSPQPPASRRG